MRTAGGGMESHCGAETYPIYDEPEILSVTRHAPGGGNPYIAYEKSGRLLARSEPDPYCPRHGGTNPPAFDLILEAEVIEAQSRLEALQSARAKQLENKAKQTPQFAITAIPSEVTR